MSPRGALCFVAGALLRRQQCGSLNGCDIPSIEPTPRKNAPTRATIRTCGFSRIGRLSPIGSLDRLKRRKRRRSLPVTLNMGSVAESVWVIDGEEESHRCSPGSPPASPQGFLLSHPPGPYTCLRTVGNRSVAMLPFHLTRLWESACATGLGTAARLEGRQSLDRRTTDTISRVLEAFFLANANTDGDCPECMTTVLYTQSQPDYQDENTESSMVEEHQHGRVEGGGGRGGGAGGKERTEGAGGAGAGGAGAGAGGAGAGAGGGGTTAAAAATAITTATTTTAATPPPTPSPTSSPTSPPPPPPPSPPIEIGRGSDGGELIILAHAWPLPFPTTAPGGRLGPGLEVLVAGGGRSLPEAKHSSWLRDRQPLDHLKARAGAQEVILSEKEKSGEPSYQKLLEGLTSNFFVVDEDGAVCTAPSEGVLAGGMREVLISACHRGQIPVRLEAPDLAEAGRWREAFLTGTGRILAPISALLVPTEGKEDDVTRDGNTPSDSKLPVSRLELPPLRRELPPSRQVVEGDVADGEGGGAMSVAERLRSAMVSDLESGATRLF